MEVGLCGHCARAKRIETRRGSLFFQCRGAAEDPRLERYPRLPVLSCPGYSPSVGDPSSSGA